MYVNRNLKVQRHSVVVRSRTVQIMLIRTILFFILSAIGAEGTVKSEHYLGVSFRALSTTFKNKTVSSAINCCYSCTLTKGCYSVNYRDDTKQCELSSIKLTDIENNSGFNTESVLYGNPGICDSYMILLFGFVLFFHCLLFVYVYFTFFSWNFIHVRLY